MLAFNRILIGIVALLTFISMRSASAEKPVNKAAADRSLVREQGEVDSLIARADSVELGKISPRIFQFAEKFLAAKRDPEAKRYLEIGLRGNSWALEEQLTLGELLARSSQPDALREKAAMALRLGEEDAVLKRASALAGLPLPAAPVAFEKITGDEITLILVPIGEPGIFAVEDLRDILARRLGIKTVVAHLDVKIPPASRTAKSQWLARTRKQILETVQERPETALQLGRMGFTKAQLEKDDDALLSLVRKTTEAEQGTDALKRLDADVEKLARNKQWDDIGMLTAIQIATIGRCGPKRLVMGVTSCDLFGDKSNYLFGVAATGGFVGVISTHRFGHRFNEEPPKRERLKERLLKQALCTFGFSLGVPRCATPECARAYPQSLQEHDLKPSTLCTECRRGFETAMGCKLPTP